MLQKLPLFLVNIHKRFTKNIVLYFRVLGCIKGILEIRVDTILTGTFINVLYQLQSACYTFRRVGSVAK